MAGMIEVVKNALKVADLRKKISFTVIMIIIFRMGAHIPVPGINTDKLDELFSTGLFGVMNIFSGNALRMMTIFAMSITPYINASIIMQLLTVAIPKLEQLAKEGEEGRKVIAQWIRYLTVILAFIQSLALFMKLNADGAIIGGANAWNFITITISFTAGTAFLMWLGEQITEYGIGNGISLIIFSGIVSAGPVGFARLVEQYKNFESSSNVIVAGALIGMILLVFLAVITAVVWVTQAERRIPIQYAKRVIGRKMYGGQSSHLPIKVNLAGVIPIIFAMSFMMFLPTITMLFFKDSQSPFIEFIQNMHKTYVHPAIYAFLIIAFTFFYTYIQFNPIEVANNLKKNGGFIPGIRPGKPTSDYIARVLNRITWFGGFFLATVTVFPSIIGIATNIENVWFAGTSVLILVGVAIDTVKQIESQMLMRHYKGFLE